MRIKLVFVVALHSFIINSLFAQQTIHIKGIIRNARDSSAVAFAVVGTPGEGCQSGLDGKFEMQLSVKNHPAPDSITIYCLGYENYQLSLNDAANKDLNIFLTPKEFLIDVVHATGYRIKTILKKAEDRIPINYPSEAFAMDAFYRQYHKENGKYVRLIEGDLGIYHKSIDSVSASAQKEMVRVKHLRRSINYEENKEQHGDHVIDLLNENPTRYVIGSVLNSKAFDFYTFKLEPDTTNAAEGRKFYHILFMSKPGSMQKNERGEILIDEETFAVTYIKIIEEKNEDARADLRLNSGKYEWRFINGLFEATFIKQGNKYYPAELFKSYLHELVNATFQSVDYKIEENFYLFYNASSYQEIKKSFAPKSYSSTGNLYSSKYEYDKNFWDNYKVIEEHFPSSNIRKDLSAHKPLDEQYKEAGK